MLDAGSTNHRLLSAWNGLCLELNASACHLLVFFHGADNASEQTTVLVETQSVSAHCANKQFQCMPVAKLHFGMRHLLLGIVSSQLIRLTV